MKLPVFLLLLSCCMLFQCAHQEKPYLLEVNSKIQKECLSIFPEKTFRAVHKIEANFPFGGFSAFIGITEIHPDTGLIKIVLLSPEGITLLDAESLGSEITINSGIPPLNKKDYANKLASDIRFLFIKPEGELVGAGKDQDGSSCCIWIKGDVKTELRDVKGTIVLTENFGDSKVVRIAEFQRPVSGMLYKNIILQTKGIIGYRLSLELIQVEEPGS